MRILLFKSESSIQISVRERVSVLIEKWNYSGYGYGNLDVWQNLIDTQAKFGIIPKAFDAALR